MYAVSTVHETQTAVIALLLRLLRQSALCHSVSALNIRPVCNIGPNFPNGSAGAGVHSGAQRGLFVESTHGLNSNAYLCGLLEGN